MAASELAFEEAGGRFGPAVTYALHGGRTEVLFGPASTRFRSPAGDVELRLAGANPVALRAMHRLRGRVNWNVGPRASWRHGLETFATLRARNVYPGTDLVWHGARGQLEYDFSLRPGADPSAIALAVRGARPHLSPDGSLRLGAISQRKPIAWQRIDGRRVAVDVSYVLARSGVRLRVGRYDRGRPLLIDPVVVFSTTQLKRPEPGGVAVNPVDASVWTATGVGLGTHQAALITHRSSSGTVLSSTYIDGGEASNLEVNGVALDSSGNAYVVGSTTGGLTSIGSVFQTTFGGSLDGWIARFDHSTGDLSWLSFIGGTGDDRALAVSVQDSSAWVVGDETGYATVGDSGSAVQHGYLLQVSTDGTTAAGTHIAPSIWAVDADTSGNVYVTGPTTGGLATTAGAHQTTYGGGPEDAFVARFAASDRTLTWATYLGKAGDDVGFDVSSQGGDPVVVGSTTSTDFPAVTDSSAQPATDSPGQDGFAARLTSDGTGLVWSTYLGGNGSDGIRGVAVDGGMVWLSGSTTSSDFPVTDALPAASDSNAFLAVMVDSGAQLLKYATKMGISQQGNGKIALQPEGANPPPPDRTSFAAWVLGSAFTIGGLAETLEKVEPSVPTFESGPMGATADSAPTFGYGLVETMSFWQSVARCILDGQVVGFAGDVVGCTNNSYTPQAPLSDGPHTIGLQACATLFASACSAPSARSIFVDTHPPQDFGLEAPADGAQDVGFRPTLTWDAAADTPPGTGVSSYDVIVEGQKVAGATQADCSGTSCSVQAPTLTEGSHTWSVLARDAVGHTHSSAARTFRVAVPPTASMSIAPNPALVGRPVTFDGSGSSDENGAIAHYRWDLDGDGSLETDTGSSPTATRTYDLPGERTVHLEVTDGLGLTATATGSVRVSSGPGAAQLTGVTINNGAQYTNTPKVTLGLKFPVLTSQVLVSNDGGFLNPSSFTPAAQIPWVLQSSGPERLPKTVYVRFAQGPIVSDPFTDDIILDERPPVVEQASLIATDSSSGVHAAIAARSWKLKIKATDTNSGVGKVQVTANKRKPGRLIAYKPRLTVRSALRPRFVRAQDRAKNFSRWRKLR